MDYEAVYLPKNHFIKAESMETEDYLALFYPFDQLDLDVYKRQALCRLLPVEFCPAVGAAEQGVRPLGFKLLPAAGRVPAKTAARSLSQQGQM